MTEYRPLASGFLRGARVVTVFLATFVWLVVPLTIGQWGRVPHTHVLIGAVTSADMDGHLAQEQVNAEMTHAAHDMAHWQEGWILSVPFGNPATLFAFLLTVAPVYVAILGQHTVRCVAMERAFLAKQVYLSILAPPPRWAGWANAYPCE